MKAFHTLRNRKRLYDFEILVMILSALKWKQKNGEIVLVTDKKGINFIKDYGLFGIWDDVQVVLDEMTDLKINETVFWAGAKILALSKQNAPCVMIDLDFILWETIDFDLMKNLYENATKPPKLEKVTDRESVDSDIYPDREFFKVRDNFIFDNSWDWKIDACNTAFVYFGNEYHRKLYCEKSISFMQNTLIENDYLNYMLFAEQRLIAMCAKSCGCKIDSFSNIKELYNGKQKYFTHIWGYKQTLKDNVNLQKDFCKKCINRIYRDFPQQGEYLSKFEWFNKYLKSR